MILSEYNVPSLNLGQYAIKSRTWEHFVDAACDSGTKLCSVNRVCILCFLFSLFDYCCVLCCFGVVNDNNNNNNKFVRPIWPYDMRPSARAEKYMCVIVIR